MSGLCLLLIVLAIVGAGAAGFYFGWRKGAVIMEEAKKQAADAQAKVKKLEDKFGKL